MLELIYIAKLDYLAQPNTVHAERIPSYDDESGTTGADRAGPLIKATVEPRDDKSGPIDWQNRARVRSSPGPTY